MRPGLLMRWARWALFLCAWHSRLFTIQTPYRDVHFTTALAPGAQSENTRQICSKNPIGPDKWKEVLERQGFAVEVGGWVMGHFYLTYALRFRREPIFADLVARPSATEGCHDYVWRVQRSRSGFKPERWQSSFALTPAAEVFREYVGLSSAQLFSASPNYPPGYP
jgi:hypothetical protein